MTDITTEQIVEAGTKKACEVYWDREGGSFTSDWMPLAVEAAYDAMLPLIRKQLADEVRAYGDPMGGPDPGWLSGLETAARLIEEGL